MTSGTFAWGDVGEGIQVLEFYSDVGRIAKVAHHDGYIARSFDINHVPPPGESSHSGMPRRSAFDLNGEAGFLWLSLFGFLCLLQCSLR